MQVSGPTANASPALLPDVAQRFIDGMCNFDVDQAVSLLCEDSRLSISSTQCAVGRVRVRQALVRALAAVYWVRCHTAAVWMRRDVTIIEADVDCERIDRARVAFPLTLILRFRGDLISDIRVWTYEPAVAGNFPMLRPATG
jgi:hypothetical protein